MGRLSSWEKSRIHQRTPDPVVSTFVLYDRRDDLSSLSAQSQIITDKAMWGYSLKLYLDGILVPLSSYTIDSEFVVSIAVKSAEVLSVYYMTTSPNPGATQFVV